MPNKMTIEAAIIELNRLKTTERMDIDRDRMTAAIDVLKDAARFRIKRKLNRVLLANWIKSQYEFRFRCSRCNLEVTQMTDDYCPNCGQALDWSGE